MLTGVCICPQDKVNDGYVDIVHQVQKATGIPLFLAPIGLAWQAVHSILSEEAADQQLQSSVRAASDLANITDPTGDIDMPSGTPEAAPESVNASSQASDSNDSASALPMSTSSSSSAAVASFVAVPNAPLAAGEAPGQQPLPPEVNLALLTALCGPRPAPAAPGLAPELAAAVTAQPRAPATIAAARPMPGLVGGLPYTTAAAGRKLLRQPVPGTSRYTISVQQKRAERVMLSSDGARRSLQVSLAKPSAAAPAASAASQGRSAAEPPAVLITRVNASAADAPVPAAAALQGDPAVLPPAVLITSVNASAANAPAPVPEVTVPDLDQGEPVRLEISIPAQSAPAPSPGSTPFSHTPGEQTLRSYPAVDHMPAAYLSTNQNFPLRGVVGLEGEIQPSWVRHVG